MPPAFMFSRHAKRRAPAWMSQKYPEVLRVGRDRVPALHGGRHNHCMTSPVYREKR
jgi:beta-galactosidase